MLILFEFWQSAIPGSAILEGQKFWYDYEFIQICTEPVLSIAYNYTIQIWTNIVFFA